MNKRISSLAASVLMLSLLASGCSNDDDTADTNDVETTMPMESEKSTTTAMDKSTTTEAAAESDIVDTAVAAGDFTTLVAAVQAAGLEETLRGDGPFTVFAPTDDAFAALPAGTVDTLLADPTGDLTSILTYHVIAGEVLAADVAGMNGQKVATVNGAEITINVTDSGVSLTDGTGNTVNVTTTDIKTSNGVIHVIDGVLLPG
ncbi:MAG: fasciclin domain-containing protein [Actinobacteria bacterium]|nr:fasciclin domain-containing protein [Actinomycetota bacterium]